MLHPKGPCSVPSQKSRFRRRRLDARARGNAQWTLPAVACSRRLVSPPSQALPAAPVRLASPAHPTASQDHARSRTGYSKAGAGAGGSTSCEQRRPSWAPLPLRSSAPGTGRARAVGGRMYGCAPPEAFRSYSATTKPAIPRLAADTDARSCRGSLPISPKAQLNANAADAIRFLPTAETRSAESPQELCENKRPGSPAGRDPWQATATPRPAGVDKPRRRAPSRARTNERLRSQP